MPALAVLTVLHLLAAAAGHQCSRADVLLLAPPVPAPRSDRELAIDETWLHFKGAFNKTYAAGGEEAARRAAFEANLMKVHDHNRQAAAGLHNFTLRENQLADLSLKEYIREMVRLLRSRRRRCDDSEMLMLAHSTSVPDELDWRKMGFVTPSINQEDCGACYAFSVETLVQAQIFKRTGRLVPLSAQQIVDCSVRTGNLGCRGGSLRNTMRYVHESGLVRFSDYPPYSSEQSVCRYAFRADAVRISDWRVLPPRDEHALKLAVATIGPVAVSINASPHTFMLYHDGVYHDADCSSDTVNHAMLLVGYTRDAWILKNWWSEHWGRDGYMYLRRGNNLCGVANFAAYAIL